MKSFFSEFPIVEYSFNTAKDVLLLSLIFVCMITFNNVCLQHVHVSFYNVARSLSIVFNVIFSYLILKEVTNMRLMITLVIVLIGFYAGVDGEVEFSLFGTLSGVLASVFVSLNGIYNVDTLKYLEKQYIGKDKDEIKNVLIYYNNLNSCVLFLPFIAIFEYDKIIENYDKLFSLSFWFTMTITGLMGFGISYVTVMQLQAVGALSHNISGTAKAAFQSLLAFYIWGNQATFKGILGIFLVLLGSALYTCTKMKPMPWQIAMVYNAIGLGDKEKLNDSNK